MERGSGFSSHGKNAKCTAGLSLAAGSSGMRMLHTNDDFPSNHPTYAPSATTYANINAVQNTTRSANPNDSSSNGTKNGEGRRQCAALREQDQYMPIANVIRIMRRVLPPHAKISDEAKETVQECVSEYISFITGEANDRCQREQRRTISAEDVLWAMAKLGFDDYLAPLSLFLSRYRQNDNERCSSVHDLLSSLKRSANAAAADCVCVPAAVTLPPMIQAASIPMGDRQFHLGIDAAAAAAAASAMPGGFHTPAPRPPSPPPPPPPPGDASQHGFTSYDPYTQYKGQ